MTSKQKEKKKIIFCFYIPHLVCKIYNLNFPLCQCDVIKQVSKREAPRICARPVFH